MSVLASLLAQVNPDSAGPVLAYSAAFRTEITRIICSNNHSATAVFCLYHVDSGAGQFSRGNALAYETEVPPNRPWELLTFVRGGGITVNKSGRIGVENRGSAQFTFTIYGETEQAR